VIEEGQSHLIGDEREAMQALDGLLADAVAIRMVADVPLGAFLSGGIDSSVVVAAMQVQSARPIRTFSIGFRSAYNEAEQAKAVAKHLGTEHTELYVGEQDVMDLIRMLPGLTDEPHGDTAILPTYLVSKLARELVTVSLSGDGGDELFAGYPRYLWLQDHWLPACRRAGPLPPATRATVGRCLARVPAGVSERLRDLGESWSLETPEDVWYEFVSHCREPGGVLVDDGGSQGLIPGLAPLPARMDPVQRMVYMDLVSRLPDSIVSKVDRTTMKVSLEARAPLMDYRLMEWSARVPTSMKIRNGHGKWLLREWLYRRVPRELVDRPKKGFKMPIGDWLRGPLHPWAEELLSEERLKREGFFKPAVVRSMWADHLEHRGDHHYRLWDILSFQAWLEQVRS
jgi:asparagine synthase (glutamine-hydrolysing)